MFYKLALDSKPFKELFFFFFFNTVSNEKSKDPTPIRNTLCELEWRIVKL